MSEVWVYIYDLSKGAARTLAPLLLGTQIGGIWHTGIVVYQKEIFYGGGGIEYCDPCGTILKEPNERLLLGRTEKSEDELMVYLLELAKTSFLPQNYNLFDHNCNTFSNTLSNFLCDQEIPHYITNLPRAVCETPFGRTLRPLIDNILNGIHAVQGNNPHSFSKPIHENVNYYIHPHSYSEFKNFLLPIIYPNTNNKNSNNSDNNQSKLDDTTLLNWWILHKVRYPSLAKDFENSFMSKMLDKNLSFLLDSTCMPTCEAASMALKVASAHMAGSRSAVACVLRHPSKVVMKLPKAKPVAAPFNEPKDNLTQFQVDKGKTLCSLVAHAGRDPFDSRLLAFPQIIEFCHQLLDQHGREIQEDDNLVDHLLLSDHRWDPLKMQAREAGFALAANIALIEELLEEDAMQLGCFVVHYVCKRYALRENSIAFAYMVRAIYALVLRFSSIADYARMNGLSKHLNEYNVQVVPDTVDQLEDDYSSLLDLLISFLNRK